MSALIPPQASFFSLPLEIRLSIYERYCDLLRRDSIQDQEDLRGRDPSSRRHSHADVLHTAEFAYTQGHPEDRDAGPPQHANHAYNAFVNMKLVSRQMRAEFLPIWLRRWVFQIPRSRGEGDADRISLDGDPDDFEQLKAFHDGMLANGSQHVRRLRLTRHLPAQAEPEQAVEAETAETLGRMLNECGGQYHEQAVLHVQVRCRESSESNRRASKDALFRWLGSCWQCFCDGPTTVSFRRDWD